VRLPLYYHVTNDLIRFSPPIIDFGFVPYRFDTLTIEVTARTRTPQSEILQLDDMLFSTSDERIDFAPGRWAYNDTYIVKTYNENGRA